MQNNLCDELGKGMLFSIRCSLSSIYIDAKSLIDAFIALAISLHHRPLSDS